MQRPMHCTIYQKSENHSLQQSAEKSIQLSRHCPGLGSLLLTQELYMCNGQKHLKCFQYQWVMLFAPTLLHLRPRYYKYEQAHAIPLLQD